MGRGAEETFQREQWVQKTKRSLMCWKNQWAEVWSATGESRGQNMAEHHNPAGKWQAPINASKKMLQLLCGNWITGCQYNHPRRQWQNEEWWKNRGGEVATPGIYSGSQSDKICWWVRCGTPPLGLEPEQVDGWWHHRLRWVSCGVKQIWPGVAGNQDFALEILNLRCLLEIHVDQ